MKKLNQRKLIITLIILVIALLALNIIVINNMCSGKGIDETDIVLKRK